MRTIQVSEKAVTIRCTAGEIAGGGDVLRLVRRTLDAAGAEPWPEIEAECFGAGEEKLVIARPSRRRRAFFFADREALEAVLALGPSGARCVYETADGFLLTLPPEEDCLRYREFGEPAALRPGWEEHAREQGLLREEGGGGRAVRRDGA